MPIRVTQAALGIWIQQDANSAIRTTQAALGLWMQQDANSAIRTTQAALGVWINQDANSVARVTQTALGLWINIDVGVWPPFLDGGDSFYNVTVTSEPVFDSVFPPPPITNHGWMESDIFFPHRVRVRHLGQNEDGNKRMVMRKGVKHFVKGDSK